MTNLIGYIKKTLLLFSITLFLFTNISVVNSQDTFEVYAEYLHTVRVNGVIDTEIYLNIKSQTDKRVLTYYTITIPIGDFDADIYSYNKNKKLEYTKYDRGNSTDILIDFENTVIGPETPGRLRLTYSTKYSDASLIELDSKILDINTSSFSVFFPESFGEPTWTSDQMSSISLAGDSYKVDITNPEGLTTKLIFGEKIVYKYNISKSFSNPTPYPLQYELIIPSDSEFQRITIEEISHNPIQSVKDSNGNYILVFKVDPNSSIDLNISGSLYMEYRDFWSNDLAFEYNSNDIYWGLDQRNIEKVESFLDEYSEQDLIKGLYNYVVSTLSYSSDSQSSINGGVRRGAIEVLKSPKASSTEDYADVMLSLLRYYNVPSKYVLGYVSDISSYQKDGMFHQWVVAYDSNNSKWMVLDPYLEDYSMISLWDRDLSDHIGVVFRTNESISPILPYFSNNDILFEFTKEYVEYKASAQASIAIEPVNILNKYVHGTIIIENTGDTIITGIEILQSNPDISKHLDRVGNPSDLILLPHQNRRYRFHIPTNEVEEGTIYSTISIRNGEEVIDEVLVTRELDHNLSANYTLVSKVISVLIFLFFLLVIYFFIDKVIYSK